MKPSNFPARKDARRRRALERLTAKGAEKSQEAQTLSERLLPDARSIKTGKTREPRKK